MKRWATLLLLLLSAALAAEETPFAEFVAHARYPQGADTFAMLEGTLQHRRRGESVQSAPVYLGVMIQKERTLGQLAVNGTEVYLLGQERESGGSTVVKQSGDTALLDHAGVRVSDLTLGFLFYKLERELPGTTLNGLISCRVGEFTAPDRSETVKVYFARDYGFPLKAEFFRPGETEPCRTLECSGFTRDHDVYYAGRIRLEGPGWTTRIEFDKGKSHAGIVDPGNPPPVVRPLPAGVQATTPLKGE